MVMFSKLGMQSFQHRGTNYSTNNSAPVTFTVRNSTMHVIYKIRVIWFIDMTPGQVLLMMVLYIWK